MGQHITDPADARSASDAAGRLFRAYERHCREPDADTIFNLFTAMHSLNDRLKMFAGKDFHSIPEFVALKALRNLAHHQEELRANVRILPISGYSDLATMCIVRRDQVERAIAGTDARWRAQTREACEAVFHWYGPAVNINPGLFNFVVRAYELLVELAVSPGEDDVLAFEQSYEYEEMNGFPHYVDGRLSARAGDIVALLERIAAEMPAAQGQPS